MWQSAQYCEAIIETPESVTGKRRGWELMLLQGASESEFW